MRAAVEATGRNRLISGLLTEAYVTFGALSALPRPQVPLNSANARS